MHNCVDEANMADNPPWVLVAAGFHRRGAMDKANLTLAECLLARETPVHVVCHGVDPELAKHPLVTVHRVPSPAGSVFLGEPLLDIRGRSVARRITKQWAQAPVVVNGGNCIWPGINWVHFVHQAWAPSRLSGPAWFRIKYAASNPRSRKRERLAFERAQLLIANSNLTAQHLMRYFGVEAKRIRTIYLGTESEFGPITLEERLTSRSVLKVPPSRPLAVFVGALGYDQRKGFDVLFESWKRLCKKPDWDVDLLVAGSGNALELWRRKIAQSALEHRIRLLGFSNQVRDILAAVDLLVSPVRYEAYGLNVQEDIGRGVPALVSASAGVAERYPARLCPMLLPDPEDVSDLVARLLSWRAHIHHWKVLFDPLGRELRTQTWCSMAEQIVSLVQERSAGRHNSVDTA